MASRAIRTFCGIDRPWGPVIPFRRPGARSSGATIARRVVMEQWPGFKPLREPKPNESGFGSGSAAGVLELGQHGERTVAGAGLRGRCKHRAGLAGIAVDPENQYIRQYGTEIGGAIDECLGRLVAGRIVILIVPRRRIGGGGGRKTPLDFFVGGG